MLYKKGALMETLHVLGEKITSLIGLTQKLQAENAQLVEENGQLIAKLKVLEGSMLLDGDRMEELNQEKALTKMVVDDLIKSIDSLVPNEKQL
jgi:hypothetical protein